MLNINCYNVDILINGKKCKLYTHESKFFMEAKEGSEYEIKIDNNSADNILAIVSIDGLDVLTGKPATVDSGGYIINALSSYRIKGYRYDDSTVGAFKFVKKDNSYAAGISSESIRNCGVIGVILYKEKSQINLSCNSIPPYTCYSNVCDDSYPLYYSNVYDNTDKISSNSGGGIQIYASNIKNKGFDMGSNWGKSIDSKITNVTFECDNIVYSDNIYYASRESLIEMGVPLKQNGRINLPESFPADFAKPPVNWQP